MNRFNFLAAAMLTMVMAACSNEPEQKTTESEIRERKAVNEEYIQPLIQDVLTQEQRDALSPDDVLMSFKEGNKRYTNNDLTARDHSAQVRKSAAAQFPKAVVLSCLDSRVPVEDVFDRGIGDIFVGRVAGNFVNIDLLGSMEFGCKVAGSKLIVVLGHEHCGAVKAAIDDVKLGNITAMLTKIRPAVDKVIYEGDRSSKNEAFVEMVCESNVLNTIETIRSQSQILKEMEDNGQIKIVGAVYDMDSGIVTFL